MARIEISPCQPSCNHRYLNRIEHEANERDISANYFRQGYQVWKCSLCGSIWGQRYQWDAGTGSDDRWHNFGQNPTEIKRHY